MKVDLFRHQVPDLKQTNNKNVYVSTQCPFCPKTPKSKSFRINLKLKVFKCYQCGRSGKSFNKFIHYLKKRDKSKQQMRLKKLGRHPMCIPNDVYHVCETYLDSLLPF